MASGILFVLHGRRHKAVTANLALVKRAGAATQLPFAIGFLEGGDQTLEMALATLKRAGIHEFIIVPILLFPATHVLQDIPTRTQQALTLVDSFLITAPLGSTQALKKHLRMVLHQAFAAAPYEGLLIAHGSPHYVEPAAQLAELAAALSRDLGRRIFAGNQLGECPYQEVLLNQPQPLIIQRVLLTDGLLAGKIRRTCENLHKKPQDIFLATLEDTPFIEEAIRERLVEAGVSNLIEAGRS